MHALFLDRRWDSVFTHAKSKSEPCSQTHTHTLTQKGYQQLTALEIEVTTSLKVAVFLSRACTATKTTVGSVAALKKRRWKPHVCVPILQVWEADRKEKGVCMLSTNGVCLLSQNLWTWILDLTQQGSAKSQWSDQKQVQVRWRY